MQAIRFHQRLKKLEVIFISHLHGDHVLGLCGLVTTLSLNNRTEPLTIVGPQGIKEYVTYNLKATHSTVRYELVFTEIGDPDYTSPVYQTNKLEVYPLPLLHRIPTYGYLFREKPKKQRFLFHVAKTLGIPNEKMPLLKQGNPIRLEDGTVVQPEQVLGPPDPSYSYAFCSDTGFNPDLVDHIRGVDVLYHEATFLADQEQRANDTLHSTAAQAATIASQAEVGQLFLGHYSARYRDLDVFLAEARPIFPYTSLALEGVTITIPRRDYKS